MSNPKLNFKEEKNASFTHFLERLIFRRRVESEKVSTKYNQSFNKSILTQEFLKDIQEFSDQKFISISKRDQWLLNEKILKENLEGHDRDLKKKIWKIKEIHDKNWSDLSEMREKFHERVREIIVEFEEALMKEIKKQTRVDWKQDKIYVNPVLEIDNRCISNRILLCFFMEDENKILRILTHELSHLNTLPIWKKYRTKNEENITSANEISIDLITSEVLKGLNKEFDRDFETEHIESYHGSEVHDNISDFKKLLSNSNSFEDLFTSVKEKLDRMGYESPYSPSSRKKYAEIFE